MNEQALNKKLAEWAGFHSPFQWKGGVLCDVEDWIYPPSGREMRIPNFTQSLDACFKWLVPNHDITCIMFIYTDDDVICKVEVAWSKEYEGVASIGKDALSLCLAIEKLIDSEKGIC